MDSPLRVTVWNENVHERKNPIVAKIYPTGIHGCIAAALKIDNTVAGVADAGSEPDRPSRSATPKRIREQVAATTLEIRPPPFPPLDHTLPTNVLTETTALTCR